MWMLCTVYAKTIDIQKTEHVIIVQVEQCILSNITIHLYGHK